MMGLTQEEMLGSHDFLNVFSRYQGKGAGGDRFPFPEAARLATAMCPLLQDRRVILLGANVARAFGAKLFRYLEVYELRDPQNVRRIVTPFLSVIPHPSGVNRLYNNPETKHNVSFFLRRLHEACTRASGLIEDKRDVVQEADRPSQA